MNGSIVAAPGGFR